MLFSNPSAFLEAFPENQKAVDNLKEMRVKFQSPEDINQTPGSSPSERILSILPDYQKTVAGLLISKAIGVAVMQSECPHFDKWVKKLIALQ